MSICLLIFILTVILFLNVSEATRGVTKNYGFSTYIPDMVFNMFFKFCIQLHHLFL